MAAPKVESVDPNANGPKAEEVKAPVQTNDRPPMKFQGGGPNQFGNRNHRGGRGGGLGGGRFISDRNRGPRPQNMNQNPSQMHNLQQPPPPIKRDLMSLDMGAQHDKNQGNRRQSNFMRDDRQLRGPEDRFADRIATISGPTIELPPIDNKEKKFGGRCRLYIGNLTNDVTKEELEELFAPYGETSEVFINAEKMFAFIRVDYRANAEKAKRELDGFMRKGRPLRVRFAPHSAAIRVKNLNQFVTNELLEWAFQVFGEIERAVVIADERGKSTGEGIVEFARKPGALQALRRCSEGCYFITSSLRPVIVEPYELLDDLDGYPEKGLFKKTNEFYKEREIGPRFAAQGSFEAEYGARWKALTELYKQKEDSLKREMKLDEEKLEAQMEYARYEHETEMLRAQLRQREEDKERQKREWELKERQADDQRRKAEDLLRRQAEDLQIRMKHQDDDGRRRQQESSLFLQAHQLTSMLEQQEQALGSPFDRDTRESGAAIYSGIKSESASSAALPTDPKAFLDTFDGRHVRPVREEHRPNRWGPADRRPANHPDDFASKRRRF